LAFIVGQRYRYALPWTLVAAGLLKEFIFVLFAAVAEIGQISDSFLVGAFIHQFFHDYVVQGHVAFGFEREVRLERQKEVGFLWQLLVAGLAQVEKAFYIEVAVA
jgi:hypothetical protein